MNHHAFTSTSMKINPSLPPKKKRTVVFRKSSYRSLKWLKKNNKTNAWRLTHTSTYNKAKDTVCMVKT